jgi:superfamily I DNA and/or RNA helicase
LVSRLLKTDATYRHRFKEVLGDHRAMQVANIEIKTVDGFEGREKEVIVFSTVRNNGGGHIGFLGDKRRLNVGLTRARRGLFVVGSLATLRGGGESWGRYARYLVAEGLVVDASDGGPRYPRQQRGTAVPRSGST